MVIRSVCVIGMLLEKSLSMYGAISAGVSQQALPYSMPWRYFSRSSSSVDRQPEDQRPWQCAISSSPAPGPVPGEAKPSKIRPGWREQLCGEVRTGEAKPGLGPVLVRG